MSLQARIQSWLDGPYSAEVKKEIKRLLKEDPQSLEDAFFQDLAFGTGGMRGIMGIGTNRLNLYTIQMATQGLANALKKNWPDRVLTIFIGYDVRHHSREFAIEAAKVLSGNGMRALVAQNVCPTPLTSFACRFYQCQAAIMITASHNPPEYNGYKVYWEGGGQVVPPHDQKIMEEVHKIKDPSQVRLKEGFEEVGSELDEAYLKELTKLQMLPELAKQPLHIVYTNLHGTGIRLMLKGLASWGYHHVSIVDKQSSLDGNFPNASSLNPEEDRALSMGQEQLKKEHGDLLFATDPDADRIAVALPDGRLTGNEIACICLEHICQTLLAKKKLPERGAVVKSIVTTELFRRIAESYGVQCMDVLTGFKYIGELIGTWEQSVDAYQYLFGAEESYGCLFGTFVRDKDSISAACLIAETAALAKQKNLTLMDRLFALFGKYGIYKASLKNIVFPESAEGMRQMSLLMQGLRSHPPKKIGDIPVRSCDDLLPGYQHLPPSNVLRFWLEDGSKLIIRPSGTEPKVKIYGEVIRKPGKNLVEEIALADKQVERLLASFP